MLEVCSSNCTEVGWVVHIVKVVVLVVRISEVVVLVVCTSEQKLVVYIAELRPVVCKRSGVEGLELR